MCDVNHITGKQLLHLSEEEGEQQCSDVRAVDVGVGHENNLAVSTLFDLEVFGPDTGSECAYDGSYFVVREHFVDACFFNV